MFVLEILCLNAFYWNGQLLQLGCYEAYILEIWHTSKAFENNSFLLYEKNFIQKLNEILEENEI